MLELFRRVCQRNSEIPRASFYLPVFLKGRRGGLVGMFRTQDPPVKSLTRGTVTKWDVIEAWVVDRSLQAHQEDYQNVKRGLGRLLQKQKAEVKNREHCIQGRTDLRAGDKEKGLYTLASIEGDGLIQDKTFIGL